MSRNDFDTVLAAFGMNATVAETCDAIAALGRIEIGLGAVRENRDRILEELALVREENLKLRAEIASSISYARLRDENARLLSWQNNHTCVPLGRAGLLQTALEDEQMLRIAAESDFEEEVALVERKETEIGRLRAERDELEQTVAAVVAQREEEHVARDRAEREAESLRAELATLKGSAPEYTKVAALQELVAKHVAENERLRAVEAAAKKFVRFRRSWAGDPMFVTVLERAIEGGERGERCPTCESKFPGRYLNNCRDDWHDPDGDAGGWSGVYLRGGGE